MVLEGKVALVTGAGRGLGRAYALRLASLGADVAINDINLASAQEYGEPLTAPTVMDELRALGRRSVGIEADVTDKIQVQSMIEQVISSLGRLDILVCNAGGLLENYEQSFATTVAEEDLRKTVDRNLYGTIFCCQAAAEPMKQNGWGKIVTVSSTSGLRAHRGGWYASYGAAKAAVIGYTLYLADELGPYSITVNAIAPGNIRTSRMLARAGDPWIDEQEAQRIALRRWGTTEDCARVIEFLCTPLSDYVTGQVIVVDGGLTLRDPVG